MDVDRVAPLVKARKYLPRFRIETGIRRCNPRLGRWHPALGKTLACRSRQHHALAHSLRDSMEPAFALVR
eukprot:7199031-Alexandrium_andersonii.AAC.1